MVCRVNATIKIITIILQGNACIPSLKLESNRKKQEECKSLSALGLDINSYLYF